MVPGEAAMCALLLLGSLFCFGAVDKRIFRIIWKYWV
jgi:hypothetical protein